MSGSSPWCLAGPEVLGTGRCWVLGGGGWWRRWWEKGMGGGGGWGWIGVGGGSWIAGWGGASEVVHGKYCWPTTR